MKMIRMKRQGIVKDERAQALAEFVLVIPVILLVFMLILQHFVIIQATQLGNYAAYVAARVYAVRAPVDKDDAESKAKDAAALVYAPISKFVPGESAMVPSGSLSDFLPCIPSVLGDIAELGEGFLIARYVRLNEFIGGGSVEISESGDPKEVNVELNYAYPIFIPGLGKLWELAGGGGDIKIDLVELREGLTWFAPLPLTSPYPYINIKSKCAMGYEDWGGMPRERKSVESDQMANPELEQQAQEMQEAQEEYQEALEKQQKEAQEYAEAQEATKKAQEELDALLADPNADPDDIDDAEQKLQEAKIKEMQEKHDYEDAKWECALKKKKLEEATGTDWD